MKTMLNHKQIVSLIKAVGDKRTVLIEGESGIGKSAVLHDFKNDPFFKEHIVTDPIDCTVLADGSVFMPTIDNERGVSSELPNVRFGVHRDNQKGVNGARPVVLFLDEIAKARQYVKDTLAPIIYDRRIGNYHLPEGSVVFCATNLSDEGLGDNMLAHLRNRLIIVTMRKPTQNEWVQDFAIPRKLSPEVIAATELWPHVFDSYMDYQSDGKFAGKDIRKCNAYIANPHDATQEQVVTPRSLHAASDLVLASKESGMDDDSLQAALNGTVGAPFGAELMSSIRFGRDIPTFARVVADPAGCPLSKNPTAQIVQVFQFITQAQDRVQVDAVVEYVGRMRAEMQTLFINKIANSSGALGLFATNKVFGGMLAKNRKFLSL